MAGADSHGCQKQAKPTTTTHICHTPRPPVVFSCLSASWSPSWMPREEWTEVVRRGQGREQRYERLEGDPTSTPRKEHRPEWQCAVCSSRNWMTRETCRDCEKKRTPTDSPALPPQPPTPKPRTPLWAAEGAYNVACEAGMPQSPLDELLNQIEARKVERDAEKPIGADEVRTLHSLGRRRSTTREFRPSRRAAQWTKPRTSFELWGHECALCLSDSCGDERHHSLPAREGLSKHDLVNRKRGGACSTQHPGAGLRTSGKAHSLPWQRTNRCWCREYLYILRMRREQCC